MNSCVYRGTLRHRRFVPVSHEFRYGLFLLYLDLDELPRIFDGRWLWSARRPAPAWFRRADHLGDPAGFLERAIGAAQLVYAMPGARLPAPLPVPAVPRAPAEAA
jgi:DUF1365 family protein